MKSFIYRSRNLPLEIVCSDLSFHHVAGGTNAYALWTKLEGLYLQKAIQNKDFLIKGPVWQTAVSC